MSASSGGGRRRRRILGVNGGDVNKVEVRWKVLYGERRGEARRGKLRKVAPVEDGSVAGSATFGRRHMDD